MSHGSTVRDTPHKLRSARRYVQVGLGLGRPQIAWVRHPGQGRSDPLLNLGGGLYPIHPAGSERDRPIRLLPPRDGTAFRW